ncbi:hypothetical protein Q2589_004604 [Salmonella enterica]|nr:hypothetical protein [Salmonella enterica]HBJ6196434.1 hypothetical protein [Salmonella enterica subsp. enterica serovar Saintpaul]ECH0822110.1 hypothetical protein [Salmonella enterica]EGR6730056.1 hypothetical protein [Salmonella enterica]EHD9191494.1 hypothetical protein [Salmonella enterica]
MKSNNTLGIVVSDRGYKVSSNGSLGIYDRQGKRTLVYGRTDDLPDLIVFVDVRDGKKMTFDTSNFPFELLL